MFWGSVSLILFRMFFHQIVEDLIVPTSQTDKFIQEFGPGNFEIIDFLKPGFEVFHTTSNDCHLPFYLLDAKFK